MNQIKLWSGLGACLLLPASSLTAATAAVSLPLSVNVLAAADEGGEGSEGGEGGEGGALLPSSYRLLLDEQVMPRYSASAARKNYEQQVRRGYDDALDALQLLDQAIEALLRKPAAASLAAARRSWIDAHRTYLRTEPLRFYDGPIDSAGDAYMAAGPEGRINAWPLNEAVIDYVEGGADSGLVQALATPITRENILARDQVSDEADVTTGYHAIEFLLWGQDRSSTGSGDRPISDFDPQASAGQRRATYLRELLALLREDLMSVRAQWDPASKQQHSYLKRWQALDDYEAVGRMLHGLTALTGLELASERLSVALDSATQEDETNCFSDSSTAALQASLEGVQTFYSGGKARHSLSALVRKLDPAADKAVLDALKDVQASAAKLPAALDQVLGSLPDDPRRAIAEQVVEQLQQLAKAFKAAGRTLGVLVPVAGN